MLTIHINICSINLWDFTNSVFLGAAWGIWKSRVHFYLLPDKHWCAVKSVDRPLASAEQTFWFLLQKPTVYRSVPDVFADIKYLPLASKLPTLRVGERVHRWHLKTNLSTCRWGITLWHLFWSDCVDLEEKTMTIISINKL